MNVNDIFPSKWVKAADLSGRPVTVTIDRCALEKVGQDQETKLVLYFRKATKGLIVNKTNAMQVAALYGPETADWVGKQITLFPATVRAFGSVQDCIRIKPEVPAQPVATSDKPVIENALDDAEDVLDHVDDNPFDDQQPA